MTEEAAWSGEKQLLAWSQEPCMVEGMLPLGVTPFP